MKTYFILLQLFYYHSSSVDTGGVLVVNKHLQLHYSLLLTSYYMFIYWLYMINRGINYSKVLPQQERKQRYESDLRSASSAPPSDSQCCTVWLPGLRTPETQNKTLHTFDLLTVFTQILQQLNRVVQICHFVSCSSLNRSSFFVLKCKCLDFNCCVIQCCTTFCNQHYRPQGALLSKVTYSL